MANEALDHVLLEGYVESLGTDIVGQMITLYQQQSKIYLKDIVAAISGGSQEQWQECCHKMKGAAASVGLILVYKLLVSIEKSEDSLVQKQDFVTELTAVNENGVSAFTAWLITV